MAQNLGNTTIPEIAAYSDEQIVSNMSLAVQYGDQDVFAALYDEAKNRPQVLSRVSAATEFEVPIQDVDVTTGLPAKFRAALSFIPTEGERAETAQRLMSDGQIKAVTVNGRPQLFYQHPEFNSGKPTLVDEYGLTARDFADFMGEAPRTGAGVAAATFTAPLSPKVQALSATAASAFVGSVQDAVIRWASDQQIRPGEIAMRRGGEAAVEGAVDYATLKTGRGVSRLLKSGPNAKPADVGDMAQKLKKAYDEVEARFNTQLDRTAGVRTGEVKIGKNLADVESAVAGSIPDGMLAKRLSAIRDQVGDMARAFYGESDVTFGQAYSAMRQRTFSMFRELKKTTADISARAESALRDAVQRRVDNLGYVPAESLSQMGAKMRGALEAAESSARQRSSELWSGVEQAMDADGVVFKPKQIVSRLRQLVRSSNLPKDEQGDVLAEFLTPQMREIGRQATGLDNPSSLEIIDAFIKQTDGPTKASPLRYGTVREWRTRIGQRIDWNDKTVKTRDMKALYSTLGEILEEGEAAATPQTKELLGTAKQHFQENVLPFRDGAVSRILSRGATEYDVADENVLSQLLSLSEVRRVKKMLGKGSDTFKGMRQAYLESVLGKASNTYDGSVNIYALTDARIDRELATELFGPQGSRTLYELGQLSKIKSIAEENKVVPPETILRMFEARTPEDVKRIARLARQQMIAAERQDRVGAQAIVKDILDGKIPPTAEVDFLDAMLKKSVKTNDVRRVMTLVSGENEAAIRQAFFNRILAMADMGKSKSTAMSVRRGKGFLWDTQKLSEMLRPNKMRGKIEAVLGKEDTKMLENLNDILHSVRSDFDKGISLTSGRPIVSFNPEGRPSMVYIMTEAPRYAWHKMLSGLYGTKMLTRMMSDTKDAREFFRNVVPTLVTTERGLQILAEEGEKDPRFQVWRNKLLRDSAPQEE